MYARMDVVLGVYWEDDRMFVQPLINEMDWFNSAGVMMRYWPVSGGPETYPPMELENCCRCWQNWSRVSLCLQAFTECLIGCLEPFEVQVGPVAGLILVPPHHLEQQEVSIFAFISGQHAVSLLDPMRGCR